MIKSIQLSQYATIKAYLHEENNTVYPAILICPGGAYLYVSSREGEPVAKQFYENGYQAFILSYSTPYAKIKQEHPDWCDDQFNDFDTSWLYQHDISNSCYPQPLLETAQAMKLLHDQADSFHLDVDRIGMIGFSAGGHLVSSYGNTWNQSWLKKEIGTTYAPCYQAICYGVTRLDQQYLNWLKINKPNLSAMYKAVFDTEEPSEEKMFALTPINTVNQDTPPTFVWHTTTDDIVPVEQSLHYVNALHEKGIPWEAHLFEQGLHGLSIAQKETEMVEDHVRNWIPLLLDWAKRYRF